MKKYRPDKAFECRARISKEMNDFLVETAYEDDTTVSRILRDAISIYKEVREANEHLGNKDTRICDGQTRVSKREKQFFKAHFSMDVPKSQKKYS